MTGEGLFWFGAPTDGWLQSFLAAAVLAAGSVVGLVAAFLLAGREVSPLWLLLLGVLGLVVGLVLQKQADRDGDAGLAAALARSRCWCSWACPPPS